MRLYPTKEQFDTLLLRTKICDPDGRFSHTSLLLMVAIVRLAIFPADAYTVGILTLALAHANAKKHWTKVAADKVATDTDKLAALSAEVQKLTAALSNLQSLRPPR